MVKNYKGGYKIIALAGISLIAGATFTIDGIHKSIEASYSKPLLIEGIVVDGVEKNDVWVKELKVVDGSFVIELYGLKLTITDEDEVTVEEIQLPVKKQITVSVEEYDLEINDGDEITLVNNHEDGATINLPKGLSITPAVTSSINAVERKTSGEITFKFGEVTESPLNTIVLKRIDDIVIMGGTPEF